MDECLDPAHSHTPAVPGRYRRQEILPEIGPGGQRRLREGRVAIVGCGALGCVVADWLARAGVGEIRLIDRDLVDATNLQRQTLFDESDAGLDPGRRDADDEDPASPLPKAQAAADRIGRVNRDVRTQVVAADIRARNAERWLGLGPGQPAEERPHVILDGTDNFTTRYLLNDIAVKHGVALVYAGVLATRGMVMAIVPKSVGASVRTACLRCVFEDPPPVGMSETCETAGVLGPAVGVAASMQACETMKILTGAWDAVSRSLVSFDVWTGARSVVRSDAPRSDCPCCGLGRFDFLDGAGDGTATALCGQDAVQVWPGGGGVAGIGDVDLAALAARLAPHGRFVASENLLRGRVTGVTPGASKPGVELGVEITVFRDGRAIIRGTRDPAVARSIYARYIGV